MDEELEFKVDEPYISTQIATLHSTISLPNKEAEHKPVCISRTTTDDKDVTDTKTNDSQCKLATSNENLDTTQHSIPEINDQECIKQFQKVKPSILCKQLNTKHSSLFRHSDRSCNI